MSEPNYKGPEYPTEAHGSIPAFNSYEEEAEFWDTHSISDFKNDKSSRYSWLLRKCAGTF